MVSVTIENPAAMPESVDAEVLEKLRRNPVSSVKWVPRSSVVANDYNPNSVPKNELELLKTSIMADGYTQPIVTVRDDEHNRWVVVDGFHRHLSSGDLDIIATWTGEYVPIVVLNKSVAERMASTVRHNRARGKHSVAGMSSLVLQMLDEGLTDEQVQHELGLSVDELTRLKYVSGFAKLFESAEYRKAWVTRRQIALRREWQREHPDEEVPEI